MGKLLTAMLAALLVLCGTLPVPVHAQPALQGLSEAGAQKVRKSAAAFLRARAREDRSANDLGWDCQAAAQLVELGLPGARERLAGIADELVNDVVRSQRTGKAVGWASSGEQKGACVPSRGRDSNVDTTCDGGDRRLYAFQSGLGMACLARAGVLLQRQDYVATASDVMAYWDRLRMKKAPCPDCVFFAASDSADDDVRYVRNMNLFIAFGASELAAAKAGDQNLSGIARRALQSDVVERRAGNRGYLGKLDPLWTSRKGEDERIENHSASVALLLNSMARTLKDPVAGEQASLIWKDWATCDNKRCRTAGCKYWAGDARQCTATATAAHCAFRLQDPLARQQCDIYIDKVHSVGGYALWSVLQARPR